MPLKGWTVMKVMKVLVIALAVFSIVVLSFAGGFAASQVLNRTRPPAVPSGVPPEMGRVWEVWATLQQEYVDKEALDAKKLSEGAIKGMLQALADPYTAYLDPELYQVERISFTGSFEGIGANVSLEDGKLTIVSPIEGSPAEAAGIRAGDQIMEIDDQATSGLTLTEAVLKIRGKQGTAVTLLVLHKGEKTPVRMEIVRSQIKLESVYLKMLPDGIANVRVTQFSEHTSSQFKSVLEEALRQGAQAIVLDMRGNPGGLLDAAIDVASQFLKSGVVIYEVDSAGNRQPWWVRRGGLAPELPLAVLVNKGSASASEVVAGALQDQGRAIVIGTTTAGKGSINHLRELSGGAALYVTFARWLTPNGRLIQGKGLTPDIEVALTDEDRAQGRDPQLERAVQYLEGKMGPSVGRSAAQVSTLELALSR